MKNTILIIILLLSPIANAQFKNSFKPATLNLRNTQVLIGEAKILADGSIKFRKDKKGEKEIYTYVNTKELEILQDETTEIYKYKIIVGQKPKLMKVIKEYESKINLYAIEYSVAMGNNVGIGPFSIGLTDNFHHYYVNKGNGDVVIKLGSSQQVYGGPYFKKTSTKFFKDCPSLVKKIKNKEYNRRKHIEEIIEYYNKNCGSN